MSLPPSQKKQVVIVGGGITGLACAYHLLKKGLSCQVLLLEKEEKLGGKIRTEQHGSFVIETGPESFVRFKPAPLGLCEEVGLTDQLIEPKPENRKTYLLHHGKLLEMPEGIFSPFSQSFASLFKTFAFSPFFSVAGKMRIAVEPMIPKPKIPQDEPLKHFIERRLGREFYANLLAPLLMGVYGGDPAPLSTKLVLREYYEAEQKFGSLFRAFLNSPPNRKRSAKSVFVTLQNGLFTLIERLSKLLGKEVFRVGAPVKEIVKESPGYRIVPLDRTPILADAVLLTTPAYAAAAVTKSLDGSLSAALEQIPYASSTVMTLAFHRDQVTHPLTGYGFLVPQKENLSFTACTWTSSKWPKRAPEGEILLRIYVPETAHDPERSLAQACRELEPLLGFTSKPILSLAHSHPQSLPQYLTGHEENVTRIEKLLLSRHPGLFVAGAAYHGVGIADCIQSGQKGADQLATFLQRIQP